MNPTLISILFLAAAVVAFEPDIDFDLIRNTTLKIHNDLRSKLALGLAPNKNGTMMPKASAMNKLSYSKLVESYADQSVQGCKMKHT
jgi:hypothetical protein